MLMKTGNSAPSTHTVFLDYMTENVIYSLGMHPKLKFRFVGADPEPIKTWDENNRRYVDPIIGYRYPVMQDTEDENSTVYRQNPVMVRVDGDAVKLNFGDDITFENLLGYRNKSYKYSFQATAIKKVK